MKKIMLSQSRVEQLLNLRESGLSWVKIEKETGIARRIAKREYDEWSAKQSRRQLEDARKEVAAHEYRIHLDLLSQMANFLLYSLVIPNPLTDLRKADEVISQFLEKDFYQDQLSFEVRLGDQQRDKRVIRMNELLFKSLRDHTQRRVPWQALDLWKEARNDCVEDIIRMKSEISKVFTNILEQKPGLGKKLDGIYKNANVIENVIEGILINMWLNGVTDVKSKVTVMKGVSLNRQGTAWIVFHNKASEETNCTFEREAPNDNVLLAKEVSGVSIWAIENLLKGRNDLIQDIKRDVYKMQENTGRLEAVLNHLVLRPIILNTRCDICPI